MGSVLLSTIPVSLDQAEMGDRSAQQVTDRMDGLIKKIYKIQGPCMHGEKPADVMLVRPNSSHKFEMLPDRSSETLGASTPVVASP